MYSVRSADGWGVLELNCPLAQSVAKPDNLSTNQARSFSKCQGLRRIYYVGGG